MGYLEQVLNYADLGYEISLISIFGKSAILMVKRHSHPAGKSLICEQIIEYGRLRDDDRLNEILSFMYNNIQEQEETGKYSERLDINY